MSDEQFETLRESTSDRWANTVGFVLCLAIVCFTLVKIVDILKSC